MGLERRRVDWIGRAAVGAALVALSLSGVAGATTDIDTAAALFGRAPGAWGMRLSPDGTKVSFLRNHPQGFPIVMAIDLKNGKGNLVVASDPAKQMFIRHCRWANEERLLCSYSGVQKIRSTPRTTTRLVAVNIDGSEIEVLAQRQQRHNFALYQGYVVDLLPDDPKHIWIEFDEGRGKGVSRVDIYKNRLKSVIRPKETVWGYWSDGRGEVRMRVDFDRSWRDFDYRLTGDTKWHRLYRDKGDDHTEMYQPAAFVPGTNQLLVWDEVDGRRALLRETLTDDPSKPREREVVFAHDEVDVGDLVVLGKHRRPVAVGYSTDKSHLHYFDEKMDALHDRLIEELGDVSISIVDESWDERFYLIWAGTDREPGTYFRYDRQTDALSRITHTHGHLGEIDLARMEPIEYATRDGETVRGYLTRPVGAGKGPFPLIVQPHGGPRARDVWGYDWFAQYFASLGYAVLQANYRGSDGFGAGWAGEGAYKGWKRAMEDIEDGVRHVVEKGVADPARICAVGWSYGGYAALMSPLENPERYQCAVSIAGVTHPYRLYTDSGGAGRRFRRSQIPTDGPDVKQGSALERASEIAVPVLLFHGDMDVNVPVDHSADLARALEKADKSVEYVEYEYADHHIERPSQRIDMLQRIADFLDDHLKKKPVN